MMKRSTKESVQDVLASKELYVSVSKTPAVTKVIWHIDPSSLDNDDDLKRKSPEGKYLKALSACLTVMVLWGIFWQIHHQLAPQPLDNFRATAEMESFTLAQLQSTADAFRGDSSAGLVSGIGGRRVAAKLLLEANDEQVLVNQADEATWAGRLGAVLHRKLLSTSFDHAIDN